MKNHLIYLFVISLFFISCESDGIENDEFANLQVSQVLALSGESQRSAFLLLDKKSKRQIWNDRLNLAKQNLNENQALLIDELLDIAKPDFFETTGGYANNLDYKEKLDKWKFEAQSQFKRDDFIRIFTSLDDPTTSSINGEDSFVNPDESCGCNKFEDYCWFADCVASKCESTQTGCGILWGSTCNGECED